MKVLLVNNFHYLRGGDCRYTFDLAQLLRSRGHEVGHFSMHHPKNRSDTLDRYFTSHINYAELNEDRNARSVIRVLTTSFWNREAQRKLTALLREFNPDVAHLQNILHHITPSIIPILSKHRIPIIHHLHDYNLICPDTYLLRDGKICEECFGGRYYRAVLHRCKKGSLPSSILAASQRYWHEATDAFANVSFFVAPSAFVKRKFLDVGFAYADRIIHIPHFTDCETIQPDWRFDQTAGVVYAGRLIPEKGMNTLLQAAASIPDIPITLLGDGELRSALEMMVADKRIANVQIKGWVSQADVLQALKNARALVMPSEWYETTGISILEAGALGRAAIVSDNSAMGEVVTHETSGLVFSMGNAGELAESIARICSDVSLAEDLGRGARHRIERVFNPQSQYRQIRKLYQDAIDLIGDRSKYERYPAQKT